MSGPGRTIATAGHFYRDYSLEPYVERSVPLLACKQCEQCELQSVVHSLLASKQWHTV